MTGQPSFFPPSFIDSYIDNLPQEKPLNDSLSDLARYIEANSRTAVFASILLLDESGKRLYRGAAPSLPEEFCEQIDGIEIGPQAGSCGTAVYCGHSIYVVDIVNDELWAPFKELAEQFNLKACWSVPIFSSAGGILGTFALYYSIVRNPLMQERKFIEECARNAAIVIEKAYAAR